MNENKSDSLISIDAPENKLLIDLARISQNNRGEPLTWGATPLVASTGIKMQQDAVKGEISSLFDAEHVPSFVSSELAIYIYALNMARTVNRESHNLDSFAYREKTNLDGIPLEALEVFDRALRGYASPAELLFIQELLGIPTIELASLTHPYGQRIEQLEEKRVAAKGAIVLMGGTLVHDARPEFEVKGSDNPHNPDQIEGIHMTRKTVVGKLPNGTEIIERSSFVVLMNRLPPECAKAIRAVPYEDNPNWARQVRRAGKLYELAPLLLRDNEFEKAIPVSTTVVAINAELEERLLSKEAMRARQRQYLASHASKI